MERLIYFDHHATTPVDPRALEAMLPFLREQYGNPSNRLHRLGRQAEDAVEEARQRVATLIGAQPSEVVFTSGGTEGDNLALKGVAYARRDEGKHIITQRSEHRAVLEPCRALEREGFEVTYLNVDAEGLVNPDELEEALRPDTTLVSIMLANNEIGTVQPTAELATRVRARGATFHCDACQGLGLVDFDVERMRVDLATLSGHKFYAPKGVGALFVRRANPRVQMQAQLLGGGQEGGWRSGTLNVAGIVGLGVAAEILTQEGAQSAERLRGFRRELEQRLRSALPNMRVHGAPDPMRHPGNLNLRFAGVNAQFLIATLSDELALSASSACATARPEASHVLSAIGLTPEQAAESLRIGLGRTTTQAEVEKAAELLISAVKAVGGW